MYMKPVSSFHYTQDNFSPEKELTRLLVICLSVFVLSIACKMAFRWKAVYFHQADLNLSTQKTAFLAGENFSAKNVKLAEALRLPNGELEIFQKKGRENAEIYLIRKDLKEIPPLIGQYKQLEGMWLSNNRLTSLPETIGHLTLLRR